MAIMFVCGGGGGRGGFCFRLSKFSNFTASPTQEANVAYSLNASKDIYIRVHAPHIFIFLSKVVIHIWGFFSPHTP